jgi:signal transduction histidine kinase
MTRVYSIRQTVSAIIHGDLQHRLPTHINEDDELNTLSRTINGMLDQIEQLVHGVHNVSNSIAHDLRTPLAELRSRLEELALIRPPPEETFAEIDGAVADVDRVIRIFDALLRLAEIDAGLRRSGFVQLDATDLAANAVEFYEPAAELKDIELRFSAAGPVLISGDPVLLAQALGNLIDNALKYAPKHGKIEVAVRRREDGAAEVSVTDNGPGIGAAEKSKVVERFYRGDASRGTPGVGLGLSLVQAVAKLHGSVLELLDQTPGLRVVLTIPADAVVGSAPRLALAAEPFPNKVTGVTLAPSSLP